MARLDGHPTGTAGSSSALPVPRCRFFATSSALPGARRRICTIGTADTACRGAES
ncbi:hypothetical protein [Streptomyces qinglanensis]|uniref:hypothetical protein n=1 Tax=Streptomyces qinglanensis TaxID=943816 RepID=UPI003D723105